MVAATAGPQHADDRVYNEIEQEIQNGQGAPYTSGAANYMTQPSMYAMPQQQPPTMAYAPQPMSEEKVIGDKEIKIAIVVAVLYLVVSNDIVIEFLESKLPGKYVSLIVRAVAMAVLVACILKWGT